MWLNDHHLNPSLEEIGRLPETIPQIHAIKEVLSRWITDDCLHLTTSGSTGDPAKIELPGNLVRWSIQQTTSFLKLTNEHVLLCIPADKAGGAMLLLRSWENGFTVESAEPTGNPLKDIPTNHRYSLISLVPYQIARILDDGDASKLKRFRTILIGGGSIHPELEDQLLRVFGMDSHCFHTYGMTETASHIALRRIGQKSYVPFSGVELSVDEDHRLRIGIPALDIDLLTNDRVQLNPNGFVFAGRVDEVVNSGGLKIDTHRLSNHIQEILSGRLSLEFVLVGEPDPRWGERLVMIYKAPADASKLISILSDHLDPTHLPKSFRVVTDWVRTSTGKIHPAESLKQSVKI